jgi:hypothetical protein
MTTTEFTICNKALALLGQSSISNFTANDKAIKCGALYPTYSQSLLTIYNWRFARKKSASLTATTAPTFGYTYAFSLPSDLLNIVNVYNSTDKEVTPQSRYERFGAVLHTAFTPAYLDYTYDIDEDLWPAWYQEFVATALAARIAISITEDDSKATMYTKIAFGTPEENGEGGMYKVCKAIDSRQQPIKPFPVQSLIAARFSGGRGSN